MSNNFECALLGDEAYGRTDAWEYGGISMQGVYASEEDHSFDNDDDNVDETKESTAGPALGGWSFATQADVASAACVGGHHKATPNQSARIQATRKRPSRPMTAPVNSRRPGQHGSMPRRGGLRPGGSVRMMPGPMAGARRSTNVTAGESAKIVARASASRGHTSTTTSLIAGQGAGTSNKSAASGSIGGANAQVAAGIRIQQEADEEQIETKTEHVKTKNEVVETKTKQVNTTTVHVETKTEQVQTKTKAVETKAKQVEAKTELVDTKTEQIETKTEQVEPKTDHIETTTKAVDTTTGQVAKKPQAVKTKTEQVETKPEQVDTTTEQAGTATQQADTTTQHGEDEDCVQLVHKEATLQQEALKQVNLKSVHEIKESRQHGEGKQACDVEPAERCETIPSLNNQATVSVGVSLENELETSAAVVDVAAPICEQTIGAHVLNYTHHKNAESTMPPMNDKRNRSRRCRFIRVVSVMARGYMYLRTHATWSTSTRK
jgi:hypothetical protein